MSVTAAPVWSLMRVMWYSNGPGIPSNCQSKSEPQKASPSLVSSAGISKWTIWPVIAVLSWRRWAGVSAPQRSCTRSLCLTRLEALLEPAAVRGHCGAPLAADDERHEQPADTVPLEVQLDRHPRLYAPFERLDGD